MVGFGSLLGSNYPGLRSIDWVTSLGIACCVMASLILLPALLTWMDIHPVRPEVMNRKEEIGLGLYRAAWSWR